MTTSTMTWAVVSTPVRARSTAHRIEPAGSGWRTACGRYLPSQPAPTPEHPRRCQMCTSLDESAWRTKSQPKTFGKALLEAPRA